MGWDRAYQIPTPQTVLISKIPRTWLTIGTTFSLPKLAHLTRTFLHPTFIPIFVNLSIPPPEPTSSTPALRIIGPLQIFQMSPDSSCLLFEVRRLGLELLDRE